MTLLLGNRSHQGEIQLRGLLRGIDVVTFEEHRDSQGLKPARSGEGIDGVARKTLDRLDQDDVDLAGLGIGHQGIKPVLAQAVGKARVG